MAWAEWVVAASLTGLGSAAVLFCRGFDQVVDSILILSLLMFLIQEILRAGIERKIKA
jgi:hypothetical protein